MNYFSFTYDDSPLHIVVNNQNYELSQVLLQNGANSNISNQVPFKYSFNLY